MLVEKKLGEFMTLLASDAPAPVWWSRSSIIRCLRCRFNIHGMQLNHR